MPFRKYFLVRVIVSMDQAELALDISLNMIIRYIQIVISVQLIPTVLLTLTNVCFHGQVITLLPGVFCIK